MSWRLLLFCQEKPANLSKWWEETALAWPPKFSERKDSPNHSTFWWIHTVNHELWKDLPWAGYCSAHWGIPRVQLFQWPVRKLWIHVWPAVWRDRSALTDSSLSAQAKPAWPCCGGAINSALKSASPLRPFNIHTTQVPWFSPAQKRLIFTVSMKLHWLL